MHVKSNNVYIKVGVRIALIVGVVALLLYAFLVRGEVGGTTFATNSGQLPLELKIDSTTFYNGVFQPALSWTLKNLTPGVDKFFNFNDVKPGDTGTSSISIHIKQGPAFVCLDFVNLKDLENGINEPESYVDSSTSTGELAEGLEFFAWRDDGDKKFEVGEVPLFGTSTQSAVIVLGSTTYALADAVTGTPYQDGSTNYVGIYWCAGDMTVDIPNAKVTCNGEALGNEAQTDSMSIDVLIRAVSAKQQPKFTCGGQPPPINYCEIEGHKYNKDGTPLKDWNIGLMKTILHSKGTDTYDLATTTTDVNGYFCLDWDGEKRTLRGTSTYKGGSYTYEYHIFEMLKDNWKNVSIEKGANVYALAAVPSGSIKVNGKYVSTSLGGGYIIANAGYHVDFYNAYKEDTKKYKKGNNGHGNDEDKNDDSNPGKSNDENDNTDDDGLPPGFVKKQGDEKGNELSGLWRVEEQKKGKVEILIEKVKQVVKGKKS